MEDNGSTVVNIALALSYADLYRTYAEMAGTAGIPTPSYPWFIYQFWPLTRTMSNMFNYTGKLEVKRMVQAQILRKYNVDCHYTNALFFFKEKSI